MNKEFEMPQANFVNKCYEKGYVGYDDEGLKLFVEFGRISEEDYKTITGKEYK